MITLGILFLWTIGGLIISSIILETNENFKYEAKGLEYLSYKWLYTVLPFNRLGTFIVFIFINLLSPLVSIGYWIFRLFELLFTDSSKNNI